MNEMCFKKKSLRGALAFILAVAMVLTMIPMTGMTVYAAGTITCPTCNGVGTVSCTDSAHQMSVIIFGFCSSCNRTDTNITGTCSTCNGTGSVSAYTITKNDTEHGSFNISDTSAYAGKKITILPSPDEGYDVDTVKYDDGEEHVISIDNGYHFTMPEKTVTVTVTFKTIATVSTPYVNAAGDAQTDKNCIQITSDYLSSHANTLISGWYVVEGNMEFNNMIVISGDVNIILADNADISINVNNAMSNVYQPAIKLLEGNTLTIWGQTNGTGKLTAIGSNTKAGIGGDKNENVGQIIIYGGNIKALTAQMGAGIGSAYDGITASSSGIIKIYGGYVYAASISNGGHGFRANEVYVGPGMIVRAGEENYLHEVENNNPGVDSIASLVGGGCVIVSKGYAITNNSTEANKNANNGYVSVKNLAAGDSTVTITPVPNTGYDVDKVYWKKDSASAYTEIAYNDGYKFTMPAEAVSVKATFNTLVTVPTAYVNAAGDAQLAKDCIPITENYLTLHGNTLTEGWYMVPEDITTGSITVNGNVNIILKDGTSMTANGTEYKAGIRVTGDNSLTIWSQTNGTGTLIAAGGVNGAGIGGNPSEEGCNITINGGNITATGGGGAAGIGGSYRNGHGESGSNITINGGIVTATGGFYAAGIGGGGSSYFSTGGNGDHITINGGSVKAIGGTKAAGIGGGYGNEGNGGNGNNIAINGGTVIAIGDSGAAGIGDGYNVYTGTIGSNITVGAGLIAKAGADESAIETVANEAPGTTDLKDAFAGQAYIKILKAYAITNNTAEANKETNHGYVTVCAYELSGSEITITVVPNSGYLVDTISVKDASNNDVPVSNNKFTMPASNVTVTVTFKASSPSGSSGSGGSSSGSSGKSEPTTGTSNFTVPVEGNKESVPVTASVKDDTATVNEIKTADIEKAGTQENITIDLTGVDKDVTGVNITKNSLENIAASEASGLEVKFPDGTVASFDKDTVTAIAEQAQGNTIQLVVDKESKAEETMTFVQKEIVSEMNNPTVLDAYFVSNGVRIGDFKGGSAEVTVELPSSKPVRIWFIDDQGNKTEIKMVQRGNKVTALVEHFSHYVIEELTEEEIQAASTGFVDVPKDAYFTDAVNWAALKGITSGTDATHFSPEGITTRAQMVTFLWRAQGSPEPAAKTIAFVDLKAGSYYEKAVMWAYENGYVKGIDVNHFAPDQTVTRGQAVAILARMSGIFDEASGFTHSFTDVSADQYYNNAVSWASAKGITAGKTPTLFAPKEDCARAQLVTFIYRYYNL